MSHYEYSFERLEVWKLSRNLVKDIYKLTEKFPSEEKFGLTGQIRRCAVSVSSNLAEGSGRKSFKDQAHFSQMSYSSLLELLNQLIISLDLNLITEEELSDLRKNIEIISTKINSLRNSQLNRRE